MKAIRNMNVKVSIAVLLLSLMLPLLVGCYGNSETSGSSTDYGSVEYEYSRKGEECFIQKVRIQIDEPIESFVFEFPSEIYSTSAGKNLTVESIGGYYGMGTERECEISIVLASEPREGEIITFDIGMLDIVGDLGISVTDRAGAIVGGVKYRFTADENNESIGIYADGSWYFHKKEQTLTVIAGDGFLAEPLPDKVKTGETVEIKTQVIIDADLTVEVNGVPIQKTHYDSDYWGYEFVMPNAHVEIAIYIKEGGDVTVPPELRPDELVLEAYRLANPDIESPWIRHYYGEFNGVYVAYIEGDEYDQAIWTIEIAGSEFIYPNANRIRVLADEVFIGLDEAYDRGLFTVADIEYIAGLHREFFGYLYVTGE